MCMCVRERAWGVIWCSWWIYRRFLGGLYDFIVKGGIVLWFCCSGKEKIVSGWVRGGVVFGVDV